MIESQPTFEGQVKEQISKLEIENIEIDDQIQPLIKKKEENKSKIEGLKLYLGEDKTVSQGQLPIRAVRRVPHKPNTRTAIEEILGNSGRPMHSSDIMRILEETYFIPITGKNPKSTMAAHLSNGKMFEPASECGRGFWKIKKEFESII